MPHFTNCSAACPLPLTLPAMLPALLRPISYGALLALPCLAPRALADKYSALPQLYPDEI